MNARLALTALTLLASPWSGAQNVALEPQEDPVQKAIREFNRRDAEKPNEITVRLDDPITPPPPTPEPAAAPASPKTEPILITGKPPEGTQLAEPEPTPTDSPPTQAAEAPAPKPRPGLAVRVEKLQAGTGTIDPSQVKLVAPFPAKPLAQAPAGWRLESSEHAPPFTREVELSPGKKITLKIRPHLLVPETDGSDVFNISEPGFEASLGYCQNTTVGAILSNSIRQLDNDSKELGSAIDKLQQLLVSLPKPDPQPAPEPSPEPKTPTRRKR